MLVGTDGVWVHDSRSSNGLGLGRRPSELGEGIRAAADEEESSEGCEEAWG